MADVGGVSYRLDADTEKAIAGIRAIQSENSKAGKSFDSLDKRVKAFNDSIKQAGMRIDAAGNVVNSYSQKNAKATAQLNALNMEIAKHKSRVEASNATMNRQIPALNKATKGIRSVQVSYQNLGYQIQDVAVMLQYGANPFLIMSTQASQLLTGPMGAMIGAFAAIAGGIAMYLTKPSEEAAKSIDELAESFSELSAAQKEAFRYKISDQLNEIGNEAEQAYAKMLVLQQSVANQADVVKKFKSGNTEGWLSEFISSTEEQQEKLNDLKRELSESTATYDNYSDKLAKLRKLLDDATNGTVEQDKAAKQLKDTYDELNANYLLQTALLGKSEKEQAKIVATSKLGKSATKEQVKAISDLIDEYYKEKTAIEAKLESDKKLKDEATKNKQAIEGLSDKLQVQKTKLNESSKEAYILAESQRLGKNATKEQREEVERLAGALFDLSNAEKEAAKKEAAQKDTIAGLSQASPSFAIEFEYQTDTAQLKAFRDAKLIGHKEFVAQKLMIDQNYEQSLMALQEERFRRESEGNAFLLDSIDALGAASTNALAGLLSGTMTAKEAMRSLANTVLNQAIGALVQMGIEQVKQSLIGDSLQAASTAKAIAAQGALATATAVTAGVTAAAWAPAAAAASLATLGANAAPAAAAITSTHALSAGLSIAGGKESGGPMTGGGLYKTGEQNKPEVYQTGKGQLMQVPGDGGKMFNQNQLDQINGGGGGFNITVVNEPGTVAVVIPQSEKEAIIRTSVSQSVGQSRSEFTNSMTNKEGPYFKATAQNYGSGKTSGRNV